MPFPPNWPIFTPAGKLANFLESYTDVLEINAWCEATLDPLETKFDEEKNAWNATILRHGDKRTFTVSHIVLATGLGGGKPKMPAPFPGQKQWGGSAIHSSRHSSAADWRGKRALVVGACTSAHDVSTTDCVSLISDLRRFCPEWRRRHDAAAFPDLCHVRHQGHGDDGERLIR